MNRHVAHLGQDRIAAAEREHGEQRKNQEQMQQASWMLRHQQLPVDVEQMMARAAMKRQVLIGMSLRRRAGTVEEDRERSERHQAREESRARLLVEADCAALYPAIDFVDESLVEVWNRDGILGTVGKIADGAQTGGVKRLNLTCLELLIEGPIVETGLAFAGRNEPLDDDKDRDDRQDDEDDGPEMFVHVDVRPFDPLEARLGMEYIAIDS